MRFVIFIHIVNKLKLKLKRWCIFQMLCHESGDHLELSSFTAVLISIRLRVDGGVSDSFDVIEDLDLHKFVIGGGGGGPTSR